MIDIEQLLIKYSPFLLIIYLIIAGNYTGDLFSCSVQRMLDNIYFKHLISFSTLIVFVIYTEVSNPVQSLLIGSMLYIWFLITTRIDFIYILALGVCLFLMYFFYKLDDWLEQADKGELYDDDDNNSYMYNILKRYRESYIEIRDVLFYMSISITLIGFFVYLGRKSIEYEREWSWFKFFEGSIHCKGDGDSTKTYSQIQLLMRGLQKTAGLV